MYVPPSTPASPSTTVNSNALSDAHQVRLWGSRVEFLFYWVDVDSTEDDTPPSKPLNKLYSSNPTNRTIQRLSRHSTEQPLEWTTTTNECLSKREAIQRTVDLEANSHFINRRDIDVIVVCALLQNCMLCWPIVFHSSLSLLATASKRPLFWKCQLRYFVTPKSCPLAQK